MLVEHQIYGLTHGAKNLMKTVFPAVAESKLSGVRLITLADAVVSAQRKNAAENFIFALFI